MRKPLRAALSSLRNALSPTLRPDLNPLQHLGALTIFLFWIVLVSGIWLFIFFRTSVEGAYESVEYLTHNQWYLGGVMRSLHRYASDAAVITMALHLLKEFAFDRYRGARNFSWITGVPLLWLVFPLGITGYWLVWDRLAQYVALSTAELIDWLPIFTDAMARNFLTEASLSDRFFTLMAFLHLIGLPLFLVFGIWLHVFRINGARINPPRPLMAGTLLALLLLSLFRPALSQGPVDFSTAIQSIGLDWFYLLPYPLLELASAGWLWAVLGGATVLLCALPWLPKPSHRPPATVSLEYCNGCERCVDDCPFAAVSMAPRSDGSSFLKEAVVDPDLCVSCGICVGACPTATPFRTRSGMVPGIDLSDPDANTMKAALLEAATTLEGDPGIACFACATSPQADALRRAGETVVTLHCMAQLPPAFVDYAIKKAELDGVFLAGCASGDCQYRLGAEWTQQRLDRQRDPRLRQRIDRERIALGWEAPWTGRPVAESVAMFRRKLQGDEIQTPRRVGLRTVMQLVIGVLVLAGIGWLSTEPRFQMMDSDQALVSLSLSVAGERIQECRQLTPEELQALPPNMRQAQDCPRERHPVEVVLQIDGQTLYREVLPPAGIWNDGEVAVYQRIPVTAEPKRLRIAMRNSGRGDGFDFEAQRDVAFQPAQHLVIEFDPDAGAFRFR